MREPPRWTSVKAHYLGNRAGHPVLGIVLHDTSGTGTHNDTAYLVNPQDGRQVSVDFTVEQDGTIYKLNPQLEQFYCNHAGRATRFKQHVNKAVNQVTVGIELVQYDDLSKAHPTWPEAQVQAVSELCAWLVDYLNLTEADITTHRAIITDGSRDDPRQFPFDGPGGFWKRFWAARLGAAPHPAFGLAAAAASAGEVEIDAADTSALGTDADFDRHAVPA